MRDNIYKAYSNLSAYFNPKDYNNLSRILMTTAVVGMGAAKALYFKNWYHQNNISLNKHLSEGRSEDFLYPFAVNILASGIWIFYSYLTQYLTDRIQTSLENNISSDFAKTLKQDNLYSPLAILYPLLSKDIPDLLSTGIRDYTKKFVNNTLVALTKTVDVSAALYSLYYLTKVYNSTDQSLPPIYRIPNFVYMALVLSTSILSASSYYISLRSKPNDSKVKMESEVRMQALMIINNSTVLASHKGLDKEGDELQSLIVKSSDVANKFTYRDNKVKYLSWFISRVSFVSSVLILVPLFTNGAAKFQKDYFPIQNEIWYIRDFISWFLTTKDKNTSFYSNNNRLYNLKAIMKECGEIVNNSNLELSYSGQSILQIKKLFLSSPGKEVNTLLKIEDEIDFPPGVYLMIGSNGSGKSTFFNALSGLSFGNTYGSIDIVNQESQIYIPQETFFKDNVPLLDIIIYPLSRSDIECIEDTRFEIRSLLQYFDSTKQFTDDLDQIKNWNYELSGGQKQAISLINAIVKKPKLLLLDEATSAMSFVMKNQAKSLIRKFSRDNNAVVIHSEHGDTNIKDSKYYDFSIYIDSRNKKLELEKLTVKSGMHLD